MGAHDALFARLRHQINLVKKEQLFILTAQQLQGKIEAALSEVATKAFPDRSCILSFYTCASKLSGQLGHDGFLKVESNSSRSLN